MKIRPQKLPTGPKPAQISTSDPKKFLTTLLMYTDFGSEFVKIFVHWWENSNVSCVFYFLRNACFFGQLFEFWKSMVSFLV